MQVFFHQLGNQKTCRLHQYAGRDSSNNKPLFEKLNLLGFSIQVRSEGVPLACLCELKPLSYPSQLERDTVIKQRKASWVLCGVGRLSYSQPRWWPPRWCLRRYLYEMRAKKGPPNIVHQEITTKSMQFVRSSGLHTWQCGRATAWTCQTQCRFMPCS